MNFAIDCNEKAARQSVGIVPRIASKPENRNKTDLFGVALASAKGYVTNPDIPNEEIIACCHQLFQVKAAFRMAKSDLKARPIYHRNRGAMRHI